VPALKLGVAGTTAEIRKAIKADDESSGLIVTQLSAGGPGALAGLRVGDLITHAGTKQLIEVKDLRPLRLPAPSSTLIRVVRDGAATFIAVTGEAPPIDRGASAGTARAQVFCRIGHIESNGAACSSTCAIRATLALSQAHAAR